VYPDHKWDVSKLKEANKATQFVLLRRLEELLPTEGIPSPCPKQLDIYEEYTVENLEYDSGRPITVVIYPPALT